MRHPVIDWMVLATIAHGTRQRAQLELIKINTTGSANMSEYLADAPSLEQCLAISGPLLLDFGTNWCGICQGAAPIIASALASHPSIHHVKVEDGPGRALGRHFRVKLWPTLIFLVNGKEAGRLVRPASTEEVEELLTSPAVTE